MTDSANVANRTVPPFLMRMPLEAEEQFEDYTRADGSSMESKLPSAGEARREWQRHNVKVFGSDPTATYRQLLEFALAAESQKGSTLMRVPHWGNTDTKVAHNQWSTLLGHPYDVQADVVATTLVHVGQRTIQDELGAVTRILYPCSSSVGSTAGSAKSTRGTFRMGTNIPDSRRLMRTPKP